MIHAYDRLYLESARRVLARMLDFAVYELHLDLKDFFDLFISSGVASDFECGDVRTLVGYSGVELAYVVLERCGMERERIHVKYTLDRSEEYWTGWALAYYQWETSLSFSRITETVPIEEIRDMYDPYHEMDIRQFVDHMNELMRLRTYISNLKRIRMNAGLSQSQLARESGVPLRTIQQYEQRQKNINKAQAEYLLMLASSLSCNPEDLLEKI